MTSLIRRISILAVCAALLPGMALAQRSAAPAGASGKELIAVVDLEAIGASKVEATAMTDRLREELLKGGRYTLVDRSQMSAVLEEQALQQTGCTSQECAVKVGKTLGVRKIVVGRVTKVSDELWQVSAQLIDVETSETQMAESIRHRGDFFNLLDSVIVNLAVKLSQAASAPVAATPSPAPKPSQPALVQATPTTPSTPSAPPAPEGPRRGLYAGIGLVLNSVSAPKLDGNTIWVASSGNQGIELGSLASTSFGIDYMIGFRNRAISFEYLSISTTHNATFSSTPYSAKATVAGSLFDARLSIPLSNTFELFGLAGLGFYSVTYDRFGLSITGATGKGTLSGLGFAYGGGFDYFRGSLFVRGAMILQSAALVTGQVFGATETLDSSIGLNITSFLGAVGYQF